MKVETYTLGPLATNCYLVWGEGTKEAIIIDPADEGDFIAQKILSLELKPKSIVATHGHFDHILAATELKLAFQIPFLLNQADQPLLSRAQTTARHFTGLKVDPPPNIDSFLAEGDKITFGESSLQVIQTPGHTPGSICLYTPNTLFSGDTLFKKGIGRTDFSYSSHEALLNSIQQKIFKLPPDTITYPGHGEPTSLKEEIRNLKEILTNPTPTN